LTGGNLTPNNVHSSSSALVELSAVESDDSTIEELFASNILELGSVFSSSSAVDGTNNLMVNGGRLASEVQVATKNFDGLSGGVRCTAFGTSRSRRYHPYLTPTETVIRRFSSVFVTCGKIIKDDSIYFYRSI
jgi:hypothetical protein